MQTETRDALMPAPKFNEKIATPDQLREEAEEVSDIAVGVRRAMDRGHCRVTISAKLFESDLLLRAKELRRLAENRLITGKERTV